MKCPRCQSSITASPDPEGFVRCPGCGARLRSRSAPATVGALHERMARLDPDTERFPDATNPDDAPRVMRGPREVVSLEALMAEVKALRHSQEEMLALLQAGSFPAGERPGFDVAQELGLPIPPTVRARQRKSVLVVDDDPETCLQTEAALDRAEIPFRSVADGRAALAAIADDKPDVIVMELDIAGPMAGKDVIDLVKATMQWVDVPIILYTRAPITSQREARTVHGADDFVSKQDGTEPMLARVVMQFRRG